MALPSTASETAPSISLVTSSQRETAQYHLMELTPDMVHYFEECQSTSAQSLKRGREGDPEDEEEHERMSSRLCIKGRHSDEAVLCTPTQTFTLREMTQSNSLLLCSLNVSEEREPKGVLQVRSNVAEIWELTPVVARTGRIAQLLKDSLYQGEEEEENLAGSKRYTPQQVASTVQASVKELQEGIRDSHAILLDGYYRMIAPQYLMESLQFLLNHVDVEGYPYESVPLHPTLSALQEKHGMRREMTRAILETWFGRKANSNDEEGADETVELQVQAIVRFIGLQLLEMQAKKVPITLEAFLHEWRDVLGLTLADHAEVSLLKGHFLTFPAPPTQATDSQPTTIQHFASCDLPLDPATRLQHLFQKRENWTLEELSPFLCEIAVDVKKRDAMLLKYARTTVAKIALAETKAGRKARLRQGVNAAPTRNLQLYSARLRYG